MMPTIPRRELLLAALPFIAGAAAAPIAPNEPPDAEAVFEGEVIPLGELLKAAAIELDAEAADHLLILKSARQNYHALVKNNACLAFFRDPELLRRPTRIAARTVAGCWLAVRQFWLLKEGRAYSVHYWCEVCAIKRFALDKANVCECCGGPMERKEEAAVP